MTNRQPTISNPLIHSFAPLGTLLLALLLAGCGASHGRTALTPPAGTESTLPVTTSVTAAGAGETPPARAGTFDRRAMVGNMVETLILPLNAQLATEAVTLEETVAQFAANPTPATLAAAQMQWRTTAEAWARVEPFAVRFTMLVQNQIKKWPINHAFIDGFITGDEPIDEAFISGSGSTVKGLAALEYLLFAPAGSDEDIVAALTADPQRMAYLVALVQNLVTTTRELNAMWSPAGDNQGQALIDADFDANNVQGSISMVANQMLVLTEEIIENKLDYPLRGVFAEAQPQAVEAPYAAYSAPLIRANLQTMQSLFNSGLDAYLIFLQDGDTTLAEAIDAQFDRAIAAVDALTPSLQSAVVESPDTVSAARDAVNDLLVLLKVDMANQMGFTITFSDNDGD